MLEVGNLGLSLDESRAHFSLWCILAAPLMAGNDVRKMSEDIRTVLTNKEVIAVDQDVLGKQGYRFMQQPGKEIWVKELSDGAWAVCFLNSGDKALTIRVNWNHLPFLKGTYKIRDLWQKNDLGLTDKNFNPHIESHDVVLVKLSPVK
jgi:alpha-galactosidase